MHIGQKLQHERLLFFSDAVFAIAITLLVIEIRLPELPYGASDAAMGHALLSLIPHYIGFAISFFAIGRFWIGHHELYGYVGSHDATLTWRNLAFLLSIAFMPFPTAVLSEHPGSRVAVMLYGGWLAIAGLLNRWIAAYVVATPAIQAAPLSEVQRRALRRTGVTIVIGTAAMAGAMFRPFVGLAILVLTPLFMRLWRSWRGRQVAPPAEAEG